MAKRSRLKSKGRRDCGSFLALPHSLLRHPVVAALSPRATKLLLDVAVEYNGQNNGDLNAVLSRLKHRGWRSSSQLALAKRELLSVGLLVQTRQGGLNIPSLYALSWQKLDECAGKLEISEHAFDRLRFRSSSPHRERTGLSADR